MSVKYPRVYRDMYCGDMTIEEAENILTMKNAEEVTALNHMIYSFPVSLIERSIMEERSIRSILVEEKVNPTEAGYIGTVRKYQTVGTAFLYASPRSILGDGVGLGKTVEIACLLNVLRMKKEMTRFLIAVETSAVGQTVCELIKYTGMRIELLPSQKAPMNKKIKNTDWSTVDGIVTTHSALKSNGLSSWVGINLNKETGMNNLFDTLIIDEGSVIKNVTTKMFTYSQNIADLCKRVHIMNATVFETSIMDVYAQVDLIYPSFLPSKSEIEREYSIYKSIGRYWTRDSEGNAVNKNRIGRVGYKNTDRFRQRLNLIYFARSKKDIGMERPNIYKVYEVYPTTEQGLAMADYDYNLVLNCPSSVPEAKIEFNRENVPKLDRLCNLVEEEFADDKVVIYCFHIAAQEAIYREMKKLGKNPLILNGQDSNSKDRDINRAKIISEFNTGDCNVLITNIMRSLNLYNGDVCIFYSMVTNPSKATQIAGRIDRNVDDKIKTFILLLYAQTKEEQMYKNVVGKRESDSRSLTVDAEGAVSNFLNSFDSEGS